MTDIALAPQPVSLPAARGALSAAVLEALTDGGDSEIGSLADEAVRTSDDVATDDDVQLALFLLYASAYGSLDALDPRREWDPALIAGRMTLESAFERSLRDAVALPPLPDPTVDAVARSLFDLVQADNGPSLSR